MAEVITPMDIDGDDNNPSLKPNNKGKNVVVSGPSHGRATPWVEKYRPQSLADVAAHRDIVDTSKQFHLPTIKDFTFYVCNFLGVLLEGLCLLFTIRFSEMLNCGSKKLFYV